MLRRGFAIFKTSQSFDQIRTLTFCPCLNCILLFNGICIPESFNANISHQLFDYTIIFVNSQYQNTNAKGDLHSKTVLKRSFLRFLVYKNKSDLDLV